LISRNGHPHNRPMSSVSGPRRRAPVVARPGAAVVWKWRTRASLAARSSARQRSAPWDHCGAQDRDFAASRKRLVSRETHPPPDTPAAVIHAQSAQPGSTPRARISPTRVHPPSKDAGGDLALFHVKQVPIAPPAFNLRVPLHCSHDHNVSRETIVAGDGLGSRLSGVDRNRRLTDDGRCAPAGYLRGYRCFT
jgi:hypothetical protein